MAKAKLTPQEQVIMDDHNRVIEVLQCQKFSDLLELLDICIEVTDNQQGQAYATCAELSAISVAGVVKITGVGPSDKAARTNFIKRIRGEQVIVRGRMFQINSKLK